MLRASEIFSVFIKYEQAQGEPLLTFPQVTDHQLPSLVVGVPIPGSTYGCKSSFKFVRPPVRFRSIEKLVATFQAIGGMEGDG